MKSIYATLVVALLLIFGGVQLQAQTNQTAPAQPVYQGSPSQPVYQSAPAEPVYTQSNAIGEIPAGTQVSIRTNENIDATQTDVGRSFSGEIAQPIMGANGQVLVPQGSNAELTVANVGGTGPLGAGSNQVSLALRSIAVNGRTYMVTSNEVQQQGNRGIGANKRTAEMTGGGALLGTLIGAVAGGGKGAAIGAAVGGAGGAAAQVLTKGKEVKVPAESLLTFRLDQPVTLQ